MTRTPAAARQFVTDEVAGRWIRQHGDTAISWLQQVPELVSDLARSWRVTVDCALPGGSVSVVVAGRRDRPVVLKLAPPWSDWSEAEAGALAMWNGVAAPHLLESRDRGRELLLERILPGSPADSPSTSALSQLLRRAWWPEPGIGDLGALPSLATAIKQRFRRARENRHFLVSAERFDAGLREGLRLASQAPVQEGLVHGDLLSKNILVCRKRGLVVIDPNPARGDVSYDIALWALTELPTAEVRERIVRLVDDLAIDALSPERVLAWARVLAVVEIALAQRERAEETLSMLERGELG